MIIKVQYHNRKKYIKIQEADFEKFTSEGIIFVWFMLSLSLNETYF